MVSETSDRLKQVQAEIRDLEDRQVIDHQRAPVLEALEAFQQSDVAPFQIPAHKAGHGISSEILAVLGRDPFRADAPMSKGLDDRKGRAQIVAYAQRLAADAFGS